MLGSVLETNGRDGPLLARSVPQAGCPSGYQNEPIKSRDPFIDKLDLSAYVISQTHDHHELELLVQGAHCAGCLSKIERGVSELSGIRSARMNLSTMRLKTAWFGKPALAGEIVEKLCDMGFGAAPYDVSMLQANAEDDLKALLRAIAVAGFAAMNVMLMSIAIWTGGADMTSATRQLFHWLSALIALPTVMYAGQVFFKSAWTSIKSRRTNMDVPISLALILACSLSVYETIMHNPDTYFDAAVMLLFLLLIGRYLDARLRLKTGEAARQLAALQSTSATRILKDGQLETIPANQVKCGDLLLIPAGQSIAADCTIESGTSDIDMQLATGETVPQSHGVGDTLYSGTINLTSPLTARVIAASADSFLADITAMVEMGEQKKGRYVRIADRAAQAYVPVVHSLALLTFLGWIIVGGDLRTASLNAIAVLIITCPCALGLAVPAVQIVTTGRLFKQGVLLRSGDALERLATTKTVIFDKTGTLTTGNLTLVNAAEIPATALSLAASLARHSSHPVAKALHQYDTREGVEHISEVAGFGLAGALKGQALCFGSAAYLGITPEERLVTQAWLRAGDDVPIRFEFLDQVREDAKPTLEKLSAMGLSAELLSGDQEAAVLETASRLGLQDWRGGVTPQEKLGHIQRLEAAGQTPLMVGDGINDAPALAAATISASLSTASDISRSTADIILQGDRLSGLPSAIRLARGAQKRVAENLGLAVIYNFLAIPLAVFGFVNPLIAALAMSGSSLLVTLNSLRMARL